VRSATLAAPIGKYARYGTLPLREEAISADVIWGGGRGYEKGNNKGEILKEREIE
jgi:hypothetical protein